MYCVLTGWCKLSNWFMMYIKAKTVKKKRFNWCSNFLKSLYDFPARPWEIFRIRQDPAATYDPLEVTPREKNCAI